MVLSQSEEEALQVARATAKVLQLERDRLFDITEKQAIEINQLRNELDHTNKWMIKNRDIATDLQYQLDSFVDIKELLVEERCKVIMLIEKLKLVANDPDWQSKGLEHDFDWYMKAAHDELKIQHGDIFRE